MTQKNKGEKIVTFFIFAVIAFAVFAFFFAAKSLFFPSKIDQTTNTNVVANNPMGQKMSRMSLTSFDVQLAKEFMDKNGDGRCDACGMPVEMCIDSGELQCSMASGSTIGKLGSQHIHADWKLYIDGKELDHAALESLAMDMSKMDNSITSSFIHLDKGAPAQEKTGDVLHMHATGAPLWIFFESVGMKFESGCLTIADDKYCNDSKKTLKFYVNDKPNDQYGDYVFNDLDKILISYGPKDEDVSKQLTSITNFASTHSKKTNAPASTPANVASPSSQPQITLPANIQSSAPIQFKSFEEEVEYFKKNTKNPSNINIEKAVQNMDANLDGQCDTCGMAILHCIEQGMEDM